jgi:hypothetical protein
MCPDRHHDINGGKKKQEEETAEQETSPHPSFRYSDKNAIKFQIGTAFGAFAANGRRGKLGRRGNDDLRPAAVADKGVIGHGHCKNLLLK